MQNRADQRRYHYIYKITRFDGVFYIGLHSTDDLDDGYFGSGTRLSNSIRYHGVEKHKKEILEFLPSRKALKEREAEILTEELRADPMCMNIAPGGSGGWCGNPNSIKPLLDPKVRARANAGATKTISRRRSDPLFEAAYLESRRKASSTSTRFQGKRHSDETRVTMSLSHQGKHDGQKNSQFGTCWMSKDGKAIKVKKTEVQQYIRSGYKQGRKS